mmetsp:Transcript_35260/g.105339  ORF Transcript_35260/g.105339 Transcript_35260/m.105339 type:complete len:367 (-) Transcript_35260:344-1444(-)
MKEMFAYALVAASCLASGAVAFSPSQQQWKHGGVSSPRETSSSSLRMGFLDGLFGGATAENSPAASAGYPKVEVPPDFEVPEPKPLTLTRSSDLPSVLKSAASLAIRLATGVFVLGWKIDTVFAPEEEGKYALQLGPFRLRDSSSVLADAPRPEQPLILYEYDASPFCKRVRETINLLDLTVEYRPCPGARAGAFSEEMYEKTGRRTVPYLVDPNTGKELFESGDQIEYLLGAYGPPEDMYDKKALWPITFEAFSVATATWVALLRDMPGARRQPNARPDNERMRPLQLWGYECSPFVRPVREKLGSLCLPHVMVSCSRGSANRDRMVEKTGRFQVPFLVDPNTGVEMFEAPEIVEYLEAVYTVKE